MKYMDWAAMGMASGAYGAASSAYEEAIRARLSVAALWEEHQRFRDELEFQKWVEELIYQFTVNTLHYHFDQPTSHDRRYNPFKT
jgi:hypothetical protein